MTLLVRYSSLLIVPRPERVVPRAFDPGRDIQIDGLTHAAAIIERVRRMPEAEVVHTLEQTLAAFAQRHDDLQQHFRRHVETVTHGSLEGQGFSQQRLDLLGAYFTEEYAIEAAALFNPSIVRAPDQRGCGAGELRFIMSLRAIGLGHLSCIEFRSGVVGPGDWVRLDDASARLVTGVRTALPLPRDLVSQALSFSNNPAFAREVVHRLPETFTFEQFSKVTDRRNDHDVRTKAVDTALNAVRRMAETTYRVSFDPQSEISERALLPEAAPERGGLEDARFVEFTDDDGGVSYYATVTAFDGRDVHPHLLHTKDFLAFDMQPMFGEAAFNKDLALFPRRIDGDLWCLSRHDRENIYVAKLEPDWGWNNPVVVQRPAYAWDLVQLGACSSPIETAQGWLVLTHGVGTMRTYAIGVLLLDLHDPTKVLASRAEPLLMPAEAEREGYVPNVLYTCGALINEGVLIVPYGCSDATVRFAFVDLEQLLGELVGARTTAVI